MDRAVVTETPVKGTESDVKFFSSGSTMLDLILGGGWAEGRCFNVVGDKSSGKTLLIIEGFANFKIKYGANARMRYAEAESAFDDSFAATLGFPKEVTRPDEPLDTVEDFQHDFFKFVEAGDPEHPGFYALDSLDALSDEAELKKFKESHKKREKKRQLESEGKEVDEAKEAGSYGVAKAKKMSEMFREMIRAGERNNVTLGVVSQIRDNIGVMFGETKTRSGGRALDFYASQVVWLAEKKKLEKIVRGVNRIVGVDVIANNKKLKVGMPYRKIEQQIIFGYGVDDEASILSFLVQTKEITADKAKEIKDQIQVGRTRHDNEFLKENLESLRKKAHAVWWEIERAIEPPKAKYS